MSRHTLNDGEQIVTAWAERASGPGWANFPVWYLVRSRAGDLRVECLQPEEQASEMRCYHKTASVVNGELTALVRDQVREDGR